MRTEARKANLREKIWKTMQERGIAKFPLPCFGRIPNFRGAEITAQKIRELEEWKEATAIFASPDSPQRKIRENALKDGKILIMASPRLKHGFLLIRPEKARGREPHASTIRGAFELGEEVDRFPRPNLVVIGSVAVDEFGRRLGKGRGYGDREIKTLKEMFGEVTVATNVHDVQVVDSVPSEEHDERVRIIVTPTRTIRVKCPKAHSKDKNSEREAPCFKSGC